jgi:DNA polymerase-3 subunit delta
MILKFYEIDKINFIINNLILLHGKNEGLKDETISKFISINKNNEILKYDEKEILENNINFYNNVSNGSLFENNKLVIIERSTDKILPILETICEKNILDVIIIVNAEILDKKSKLRSFFEKNKKNISIAFYPDTNETLIKLTKNFFNKIKIPISFENINIIVDKCAGDRKYLINELEKISHFVKNKKKIETIDVMKLTNLTENFSINELIDVCLSKNKKKTISILSENNFSTDDTILIIRTFLNKSKRLLNLLNDYEANNNLNTTLLNAKPPIFWKDKEIVKKQIKNWTPKTIKDVIYSLNKLEVNIKKVSLDPLNIVSDFILNKSSIDSSN